MSGDELLKCRDRQRQAGDHACLPRDQDGMRRWAASGMVAIEVMSPARPRSSSSARCTASSMASGDKERVGVTGARLVIVH